MLLIYWMGSPSRSRMDRVPLMLFSYGLVIFNILYVLVRDCLGGISPGKLLLGIRVVDFKTGEAIGPAKSFLRNWIYLLPFAGLVELAVASTRPDKRRLGDLVAGTVVVLNQPATMGGNDVEPNKPERDIVAPNPFE